MDADTFDLLRATVRRFVDERLIPAEDRLEEVERFYRDVRLLHIYEGTSQIQQLVIARGMIRGAPGP